MLTTDFLVPSREGIIFLLRREKCSSYCRGNFFPAVGCYISLFTLFPNYIYMKINGRFPAGHRSAGQSGHKIRPLRKKFGPFCQIASVKFSEILVNQSYYYREN